GDVTGPLLANDESVAIFDGVSGKVIKDSDVFISGRDELNSPNIVSQKIDVENISISEGLTLESEDVALSGSNQDIPDVSGVQISLTGSALVSISNVLKSSGNTLTVINKTTNDISINDGAGILTGTESEIVLAKNASILLQKNGLNWHVVGGVGSGG